MNRADTRLIEQIQQATRGGRALLVTLGRRGKALERAEPERAAFLLAVVRPHPLYKGGRLAFDMLEIEDLMLDGPPVDPVNQHDLARMLSVDARWQDLTVALQRFGSDRRDGEAPPATAEPDGPAPLLPRVRFVPEAAPEATEPDPELSSSDYLYDLVVLGFLDVLGGTIEA